MAVSEYFKHKLVFDVAETAFFNSQLNRCPVAFSHW